ncbi:MAG: LysR substrate-binding domain-containing protein [Pseudomonadota bacterium]
MIDTTLLKTFAVVAETEHFTRAAERLNCVQSAVSMQVKRLEASLQVRLFERQGRGIKLTEEGRTLLRYAHRLNRLTDELLVEMGRLVPPGRIRIGATDITMSYMPQVLERLHAHLPMVDIELRCNRSWEALDALDAGDIDIAFVTQHNKRPGARRVHRTPLVWACATHADVHMRQPLPLAIFGVGCIYRKAALAALDKRGIDYRLAYESPSRSGLECAVEAGLAVTIIANDLLAPHLRVLPASATGLPSLPVLNTYVFTGSSGPSPIIKTVIDRIVEAVRMSHG